MEFFPKWNAWKSHYPWTITIEQGYLSSKTKFVSGKVFLWQGFWCFHGVRELWISGKSCEIHKNMQNTINYSSPAKPLHIFHILCKKRLVKGRVLSTFFVLFLNAVSILCSALFQKIGFLSQNAAAKASIQRLHILTSKGCKMAAVSMKHWNDLTWFHKNFMK